MSNVMKEEVKITLTTEEQTNLLDFLSGLHEGFGDGPKPEKVLLADEAFGLFMTGKLVHKKAVMGLLDTLGGFYMALHDAHKRNEPGAPDLEYGEVMFAIARKIECQANLKMVLNGGKGGVLT